MSKKAILVIIGFLACFRLVALEVLVVRFFTIPDINPLSCLPAVGWYSQTLFHNSTDASQTVQFLGVSNGTPRPDPRPLSIPPHQTVSVLGARSLLDWEPLQSAILWVNRLDVPQGVVVANRVQSTVFRPESAGPPCNFRLANYAGLPLPVFSSLIPAGTSQYFLGTDVGSDPANVQVADARLNVGVYNAGLVTGTAIAKVYCGYPATDHPIPDTLLQTDQWQIPSNSVLQKTVLPSTAAAQCPNGGASFWYATVTVDQPSFAYAIGLANGTLPTFPGTVALTYTGN